MPASQRFFVDRISILTPAGFQAQFRETARQEDQTASEFIRQAVRDRLRAAEQAEAG